MALVSLIYVSFASHTLTDEELQSILAVSRRNNMARNLTGMLLYRDGFFIQALEGEQEIVDQTFRKIATDPRHHRILKIYENEIKARSFGDWVMGFNKIDDHQLSRLGEGYTDFLANPDVSLGQNPSRAIDLLEAFRDRTYF